MLQPPFPSLTKLALPSGIIYALATARGYRDLTGRHIIDDNTIGQYLADGDLSALLDKQAQEEMDYGVNDISVDDTSADDTNIDDTNAFAFAPCLPNPQTIFCIGVNYANRNEEYKDGEAAPANPSVFIRTPASFTGHNQPLLRPPESEQFDYEGEIVIIIGKPGRRIPAQKAARHIAGLTLANDGTLRDWVRHAKFNVTQGKNFEKSGSIGPWIVPAVHFDGYDNLPLHTKVNGEIRQEDSTANLIFSFTALISYLSIFTTLQAGDMILTGTPTGAGARFDPPKFLKAGDKVDIVSAPIGQLINSVADEPLA